MRTAVVITGICLSLVGISFAEGAKAAAERVQTRIPPEALGPALEKLAQTRGMQVLYFSAAVKGMRTGGATGNLTADEALTRILTGTGLTYRYVDPNAVTILPGSASGNLVGPSAGPAANHGTKEGKSSSSRGFRVAQMAQTNAGNRIEHESEEAQQGQRGAQAATLQEVIVTAEKRPERLIDTPESLSVVSADSLGSLAATQFRDWANTVPGLDFSTAGAGYTQVFIRGVTSGVDTSATVGIYLDDVPIGSSTAFAFGGRLALDPGLFDVDRIDVLRGPQGTIYGASALAGVIKYISTAPNDRVASGKVQTGVSSTESGGVSVNAAGTANVPLVPETLALRATAYESHDGGFIDNVALNRPGINRSDIYGGRVDLLFTPTESVSVRVNGLVQDITRDGQSSADYGLSGGHPYGRLGQHRVLEEYFNQQFRLVSATISGDLGPAELTSVSAYQAVQSKTLFDISAEFVPLLSAFGFDYGGIGDPLDETTDRFTQEVRLASKGDSGIQWLVGAFYDNESANDRESFVVLDPAGRVAPNIFFHQSAPTHYEEYAGFGDVTLHLGSSLEMTGGVRYAHDKQDFTQHGGTGIFDASIPTIASDESVVTYLGNVLYRFDKNATAYVRYATGYRPGGPNFVAKDPTTGAPLAPPQFEADKLKSYEGGLKSQTEDRRFSADADVYYEDWENMQVLAVRGGFGVRLNAPGATIRGAELTLATEPVDGLKGTVALAYQDAKMKEADADIGASEGERLPDVPRYTASMNVDYLVFQSAFEPTIGATVRYVSSRDSSLDNNKSDPQYHLPAYTSLDLRFAWTVGPANLQFYIRNATNELGELSAFTGYASLGGPAQVSLLQPRTYGVSAVVNF